MRGMQQALLGGDRREDDDLRQYHDAVSPADLDVPAGGADVCLKKLCSATGKSESNKLAFPHANISGFASCLAVPFQQKPKFQSSCVISWTSCLSRILSPQLMICCGSAHMSGMQRRPQKHHLSLHGSIPLAAVSALQFSQHERRGQSSQTPQ